MIPKQTSKPSAAFTKNSQSAPGDSDGVREKAQILEDIGEGYLFVKAGGLGQPIDDMHREIAEELAREELKPDADSGL